MSRQEIIKIFGDRKIRSVWDDEAGICGKGHGKGKLMLLAAAEFVGHLALEFLLGMPQQWNEFRQH